MDSVNSAQALERVCSDMDFITLTCPETEDSIASPMNIVDNEEDDLLGLQPIYDKNKMEELFDPSNTPSPLFISSIRNFVGNLVYGHFRTP